jgi:hypothetical protein
MMHLENFLANKKDYQIILISFVFLILLGSVLTLIKTLLNIETVNTVMIAKNNWEKFVFGVLIGPLVETFIFQFLIEKIFNSIFKNIIFLTLFSAILFGLNHHYGGFYILYSFILGFYFTYLYLVLLRLKRKAFLTVLLLHSFYNLFVFLGNL